jgi:hypothetical protein
VLHIGGNLGVAAKVYKDGPHVMCTTLKDQVNADLMGFLKE